MVQIEGKYSQVRSENLDEYFKAMGVPYIPRKMICASSPTIEISKSADDKWTITTNTILKTVTYTFKLGEDYEETMPGGVLKSNSKFEGDKLITVSVGPDGAEMVRTYSFSDDELIITYVNKKSQTEATRYFRRIP